MKKLRITRVRTTEVRNIPTGKGLVLPWDAKKVPQDSRDYVITQFFTDQGIVGTTMDGDYKLPDTSGREVQERAEAYFVGKDPFEVDLHNAEFIQKQRSANRVRFYFLEIALWDIIGKALGQPLYRLWGAATSKVQPYASTVHFYRSAKERAEDALKFYELGFRAMKIKLHQNEMKQDLALAQTVMDAARGKIVIMADANQGGARPGGPPPNWDYERALQTAIELEKLGLYWLEEPLNFRAYDELARVRRHLKRMHLAGGENNHGGLKEYREVLTKEAYSYIQPDPIIGGGVSVIRKIAAMGEAFGVLFGPHFGKSGLGTIVNLHIQCAAPNSGYLEFMFDPGYWNSEAFQVGFAAPYLPDKEGYLHAPGNPGVGIEWDRKFFQKYGLHYS
jgi:L-alanine-DL-glutamate epimerase-like enolase superfamily enzyme